MRSDRLASMLSSFMWVVAAVLICAGAYYGLAHLPSRSTSASPVAAGSSVTSAQAKPAENRPAPHASSGSGSPAPAPATAPAASTPTSPAETPAAVVPPPAVPSSAPIQLVISATGPVWVTAVADGKTVVSELMNAGTSKIVDATGAARLRLGSAGAASITFNGKKLEPFGGVGEVRSVMFTPEGAQVISLTSPKVEPSTNPDPLR